MVAELDDIIAVDFPRSEADEKIRAAADNQMVVGSQARILYADRPGRVAIALAFNDAIAGREAINHNTSAILLEPIQGEGGVNVAEPDFLLAVKRLSDILFAAIGLLLALPIMLIVSATLVDAWSDLIGLQPGKGLREAMTGSRPG